MLAQKMFEEPEVFRLEVPFSNIVTQSTNVYFIKDGEDVLIVDTGAPTQEAAECFLAAAAELRVDLARARVFFTHLHFDHAGLAERVLPQETEIFIGQLEMRAADSSFDRQLSDYVKRRFTEEGMTLHEASEKAALVEIATPLDWTNREITLVENGDAIEVGRFELEVVELPGHTRGMCALYEPQSGICFSGDQLLFVTSPACALFLDEADSVAAYARSMDRLLELSITHLYHSHGPIRQDFRERAAQILAGREKRLDQAVKTIAENPGINGVEAIKQMGWKVPFASIDECDRRQQWLIYTQGIALLDHLVYEHRIERIGEPALLGSSPKVNFYNIL